jgi:hypothetical protein
MLLVSSDLAPLVRGLCSKLSVLLDADRSISFPPVNFNVSTGIAELMLFHPV